MVIHCKGEWLYTARVCGYMLQVGVVIHWGVDTMSTNKTCVGVRKGEWQIGVCVELKREGDGVISMPYMVCLLHCTPET